MQRLDNNDPKRAGAAFHKFQQKPGSPSKSARSPARTPVSGTKPSYSRGSRSSASPLGLPTTPPKQSSNRSFRRSASPLAVRNTLQLAGPSADPPAPAASILLGSALEAAAGPGRSQRSSGESTSSKGEKKKKKKKSKRKPNGALAAIDDALDDDEDEERGASGAGSISPNPGAYRGGGGGGGSREPVHHPNPPQVPATCNPPLESQLTSTHVMPASPYNPPYHAPPVLIADRERCRRGY